MPYFLFMTCLIFAVVAFDIWNQTALTIGLGVLGAVLWLVTTVLWGRSSTIIVE